MAKKFYRRKRLWIPLLCLLPLAIWLIYLSLNPLQNFRKSLIFVMNRFGIHEKVIHAGNYQVHVFEGGEDNPETVVLLHGFGGNALFTWMQLMPVLKSKYHVIAPDLLASNFLRLNPQKYSVRSEVDLTLGVLQALDIKQADFVGLSVGGWVSLIIALEHPELVHKLILLESAGITTDIPELARLTLTDREKAKRFMNLLFYYPPPLPGFVLDEMIKASTKIKPVYEAVFMGFIENSRKELLDEKLGAIRQPTLIVQGREDQVIHLEVGERLHQMIPGSDFLILEKSGHAPVWDSPFQLKRAILDFLAKPDGPSPESHPSTSS